MSRRRFLESTVQSFTRALSKALISEQTASMPGLLQQFDPRVRLLGVLALVIATTLCRRIPVLMVLFAGATVLAFASRVKLSTLTKRVWLIVLAFTGVIAIPALFVTPGSPILSAPEYWFVITAQGLHAAGLLILRVETAVTFTTALVLSTHWTHLLKSLRAFGLPTEIISMLAMTHRYIFLLIETANQMFESRQSRIVGQIQGPAQRRMASRTAGVLLSKSIDLSDEVFMAMQSRGFRGEICLLDEFRMTARDYVGLITFLIAGFAAGWAGR